MAETVLFSCMNAAKGCTFMGDNLLIVKNHYKNGCTYYQCRSKNCTFTDTFRRVIYHQTTTCPLVPHRCSFCEFEGFKNVLDQHVKICVERFVKCKFCQEGFRKKNLDAHQLACAEELILCGKCNSTITRSDYLTHADDCNNAINGLLKQWSLLLGGDDNVDKIVQTKRWNTDYYDDPLDNHDKLDIIQKTVMKKLLAPDIKNIKEITDND